MKKNLLDALNWFCATSSVAIDSVGDDSILIRVGDNFIRISDSLLPTSATYFQLSSENIKLLVGRYSTDVDKNILIDDGVLV